MDVVDQDAPLRNTVETLDVDSVGTYSDVWKYFEKKETIEGQKRTCFCKGCKRKYIWGGSYGTKNLLNHVEKCPLIDKSLEINQRRDFDPSWSIECNVRDDCHFVLTFDPSWSRHHYEVVKISYSRMGSGYIFEVFTSKTGRWDRKFSVTDYKINLKQHSCFANGLLYMFERCDSCLIAIDCADGSYKRVRLPCTDQGEHVGKLCNSSGTLMYSKLCRGNLGVWTLVKNENGSCWIPRHSISLKVEVEEMGFSGQWYDDYYHERTVLFELNTIILEIGRAIFFFDLESYQLQAVTRTACGDYILPWSPCLYAVAGL